MVAATSIVRAYQIVLDEVERALRPFALTFARYEALVLLSFSRTGALPLGKMGQRLQVHPTSVTNVVDRLAAQGLVVRVAHPTDRRTVLAELTPAGRDVVGRATAALTRTGFGLPTLEPDELASLTAVLRKVRRDAGDFDG
ncbi:MAG: MarR family transcriptional regulator [Candidatus Dormibacteraeota bacterium]|nr:MarR family transcriptional regulator [Candidatus Dormibacteraeota bacterium]